EAWELRLVEPLVEGVLRLRNPLPLAVGAKGKLRILLPDVLANRGRIPVLALPIRSTVVKRIPLTSTPLLRIHSRTTGIMSARLPNIPSVTCCHGYDLTFRGDRPFPFRPTGGFDPLPFWIMSSTLFFWVPRKRWDGRTQDGLSHE